MNRCTFSCFNRLSLLGFLVLFSIATFSCKKDNQKEEESGKGKLYEVVDKKYVDEMKSAGMKIYEGTTPPAINSIFHINPLKVAYKNFRDLVGAVPVGKNLGYSYKIQLSGEPGGKNFKIIYDLSYFNMMKNAFIQGSGNDFTICYTLRDNMTGPGANDSYDYAYIISGTLDDNKLKNVQIADVVIKVYAQRNPNPSEPGYFTIIEDADGISEQVASLN